MLGRTFPFPFLSPGPYFQARHSPGGEKVKVTVVTSAEVHPKLLCCLHTFWQKGSLLAPPLVRGTCGLNIITVLDPWGYPGVKEVADD